MIKLSSLLLVLAACGGDRQPAAKPAPPPAPPVATSTPPPAHPAPVCPLPALAAFTDPDAPTDGLEGMSRIEKPRTKDACELADTNITRAEGAILAAKRTAAGPTSKPWDRKATPERMKQVARRLALVPEEKQRLNANGFVVLGRHPFGSYALAYHEIYQSQLPVFISIDSVLHAIYQGNDSLIAELEDAKLAPMLGRVIDALACALPAAAADYPADTRRDLDLYLTVARALLRGEPPASMFGDPAVEAEAGKLVAQAMAAAEMSSVGMFGRARMVDFTAYTPRSHYAKTEPRQRYFRAAMWLSRIELNLVSRSSRSSQPGDTPDPAETPREDVDALALADLVARANAMADVTTLDAAWGLLAGKREDVSVTQLLALRTRAGIAKLTDPDAAAKLRTAIGKDFQRTARLHYMPEGSTVLPAITTLLGPRVVPDAAATRPLVNGDVPGRTQLFASDMGYVLGHDRALVHLATERQKFPSLDKQLATARQIVETTPRGTTDLYSAWMDAVVGLAKPVPGALPSFMATPAYADLRLDSALAAFGQIKHNYVLIAGESYFEGGCVIPDGYVEPAPATYAALIEYAARGERVVGALDPDDALGAKAYFHRLTTVLGVLRTIGDDELANRPLSIEEKQFVSMVAEMEPGTTGGPPTYTGWWFDMFRHRELDGLAEAGYIASYFTGDTISYVGASAPVLGVFVVDTGGAPRAMVGPVARAYEYHGPVAKRLDDAAGKALADAERSAPWSASYFVAAPPEPKLKATWDPLYNEGAPIVLTSPGALGPVTISIYDHNRDVFITRKVTLKAGKNEIPIKLPKKPQAAGFQLQVGGWSSWLDISEVGLGAYGTFGGYDPDAVP